MKGVTPPTRPSWREPRRYRAKSHFVTDDAIRAPLDRNQKARIIALAEALEARTRQRGRQNGAVSRAGLMVLRVLLFRFMGADGRTFPSLDTIAKVTGLCRQTVSNALGRLSRVGLVRVVNRIARARVTRRSPIHGEVESYVGTLQLSNAYVITPPPGGASLCAPPPTGRASFPPRRQGVFAQVLAAVKPSLVRSDYLRAEDNKQAIHTK